MKAKKILMSGVFTVCIIVSLSIKESYASKEKCSTCKSIAEHFKEVSLFHDLTLESLVILSVSVIVSCDGDELMNC